MEQLINERFVRKYYRNELTYRDLEKQFGIKFDDLFKIDSVEKNLQRGLSNLDAKIDAFES
ncbi:hypothetical protein [Borreliella tanukii]|uniref:hypothetical protein n=1 Tax=Borreliella tanukii TaxID=56146 RepID=UPI00264936E6|nr:hypothetical protein [Borreliella tanukii]WKC79354.1 hypothetical protein QIA28_00135 [Borreliella tanukii]WKC80276.1 hypothetical protein QIA29_00135 [Borreliella tanukii]WKC81188.1 hypothetical protein QIA27_00135 [Borreliella tanukii]WKC82104.1 hypothetical protein QIA26_00135 [Borreliella tanukii]